MSKRKEESPSKKSKREESSEEKKGKHKIHKEEKKKEKEGKKKTLAPKKLKKSKSFYKSRQGRFNDIVTDSSLYAEFHAFLMKEFCEENLEFYRDAVLFERMPANDTGSILKSAQNICEKYFGFATGENVVHLDPWQARLIKERLNSPSHSIFLELREEVEQLLQMKYIHFVTPSKE